MKTGKTSAATLGLLGGLALGAWIGTEVKMNRDTAPEPAPITAAAAEEPAATTAPELHEGIKPVLAPGTKLPLAAEGFVDAEQFATLAHAARNTQVPFILLKHRVLAEGQSLEDAIRASRPELDARVEALKAKGMARADVLTVRDHGG